MYERNVYTIMSTIRVFCCYKLTLFHIHVYDMNIMAVKKLFLFGLFEIGILTNVFDIRKFARTHNKDNLWPFNL